jgi:predicted enzyme related to lactoylglutathione lyase
MKTRAYLKIKDMSPQFLVTDIKRSIEFYTKKLGFEIGFCYEDFYCAITKDGYSIHLKLASSAIGERENRRNNGHLDITFSVDGIEDLYEEIKNKPVEIIQVLRDMPYGREFYISDPDGYILAFLQAG